MSVAWSGPLVGGFFGSTVAPLATVAESLEGVISPIQSILSTLQSILNIIRVFIRDASSILLAIVQTLVNMIEEFLKQLANSGLYILLVAPDFSSGNVTQYMNSIQGGFDGFITKVTNSFTNSADPQRPLFDDSTPCAGVVLGISSGTIMNASSFISLLAKTFKGLMKTIAVPPTIKGYAGNEAAVIYFSKPQVPNTIFSNVTYAVWRSTSPGGTPVLVSSPTTAANAKITSTMEISRDTQTNRVQTTYDQVGTIASGSFLSAVDYIFIDGDDVANPQLVKFNLSVQSNSKALTSASTVGNPLAGYSSGRFLGPKKFSLRRSTQDNVQVSIFDSAKTSTKTQIEELTNLSERVRGFFIGSAPNTPPNQTYYLEVRINGSPVPTLPNSTTATPGGYIVMSFDGDTFTLNQQVPLGAKVEAYTYIQAKSGDVVRYQQLNKYHPSAYAAVIYSSDTADIPLNGQPYYYKIEVLDNTVSPPVSLNPPVTSNEIRVVPQLNISSNPPPAYCMGQNPGPFVFTQLNNLFIFSVGQSTYYIRIRPSVVNVFSTLSSFQQNYGLLLDPRMSAATSTNLVTPNTTSGINGLNLQFTGYDGSKQVVPPGALVPIDVEDVLGDFKAQCHNPSVKFSIRKGCLVIQDLSASAKQGQSQVVIGNGSANTTLGFTPGVCNSVALASKTHWERLAMKDIIPQINELAEIIEGMANSFLRSTEGGVQSILDFITLIQTKITVIQSFLTEVEDLLTIIQSLKVNLPNIYKLNLPVVNGSAALQSAIQNSTNRPPSSPSDFASGICIVVGGVSAAPIATLLHTLL